MTGHTFGRKQTADGAAMAARREAFLAGERARAGRAGASGDAPILVHEKTMGIAYLLWFFFGGLSVHRFYLGFPMSGAIQAALLPLTWALAIGGSLLFIVPLIGGGLWVLADAFIIPSMCREANARMRRAASASVFT